MEKKLLPYLLTFGAAGFALFVLKLTSRDTLIFMILSLLIVCSGLFSSIKKAASLRLLLAKSLLFSLLITVFFAYFNNYQPFQLLLIGVTIFLISFIQAGIYRNLRHN